MIHGFVATSREGIHVSYRAVRGSLRRRPDRYRPVPLITTQAPGACSRDDQPRKTLCNYHHAVQDLWDEGRDRNRAKARPLAHRLRPASLDEVLGQDHLLGEGEILRRMVDAGVVGSIILHGPPGTGKTTLAVLVAEALDAHLERENAAAVGVPRIREILAAADRRLGDTGRRTILFLDEIHRFSRSQQDVLLGDVERGGIALIGATTENPWYTVNSALTSRSTVIEVRSLDET